MAAIDRAVLPKAKKTKKSIIRKEKGLTCGCCLRMRCRNIYVCSNVDCPFIQDKFVCLFVCLFSIATAQIIINLTIYPFYTNIFINYKNIFNQ